VEVAKEISKATSSIKTSVDNMMAKDNENINNGGLLKNEIEIVEKEKEEQRKLVKEQKKIVINFLGKSMTELKTLLGDPQLIRFDGNTKIVRYDNFSCKLFLFLNSNYENSRIEHFEIRNRKGNLINVKEKIENCYKNFQLT
tara:strand:- start:425 stop:850 length:426 start_codon:yes stop_codon:yes gene_type:complete